ncbi:MAG: EMC3/TMCO1 family protein [archaeon]|nr:EMC3/TMCO1 family protein [archaeon]|tara:strand:- start:954 stop:1616 length:663 start_codon:yes stop_codon:yes gene_type:complete
MSEENTSEEEVQPPAMGGMLLTMLFMVYILLNPEMRVGMGNLAENILEPQIGFEHEYPVLTFLFAGVLMISLTTIIRHILIDWEKVAEIQTKMAAYNKEMSEARRSGNNARLNKLMTMQPQVMVLQSEMMSNQMRPMMFTMLIAMPIIFWLCFGENNFVDRMDLQVMSLPWEPNYSLTDRLWILPHSILIYSALSLPFGQILMRFLKLLSLSKSEKVDQI